MAQRRADLTFRTTQIEKCLNIGNADWVAVGAAAAAIPPTTDFYVSGYLVKSWDLVNLGSDGGYSKTDPLSKRKMLMIMDGHTDASKQSDHFLVYLFGVYAEDFENLNVSQTLINLLFQF